MQRLRLSFGRGEEVKFISHLDMVRFWERALRRAGVPLLYSQGFTPHPRIAMAAPLPVGVTSEAELMDVWLDRWLPPQSFLMGVREQLLRGFKLFDVWQVGQGLPSLQSVVAFAEYHLTMTVEKEDKEIEKAIQALLGSEEIPWHHSRGGKERSYNLRSLVDTIWLVGSMEGLEEGERDYTLLNNGERGMPSCGKHVLGMRLSCGSRGNVRPEEVATALGFSQQPDSIHRTKLVLENVC
jgi:radical SAM-linked protein